MVQGEIRRELEGDFQHVTNICIICALVYMLEMFRVI